MSKHAKTFKIAVLASGTGSNFRVINEYINENKLPIEICCLLSDKPQAGALTIAKENNINAHIVERIKGESREAFDARLLDVLNQYDLNLVVLAGFMRILSSDFVKHFENRLVNIHPSLLPKYKGLNTHQRTIDNGDKEHGATVHWVIDELDAGDVILQGKIPILENDTAETLQQRIHEVEYKIYPAVVKKLAEKHLGLSL